jgi:hypothetical protein
VWSEKIMNGVKIKVVSANKEGKIELTKLELENLLNEAYRDGYSDGRSQYYTCTGISTTPYYQYNTISTNDTAINGKKSTTIDTDLTVLASDSKSSDCAIKAVKVEDANYVVQ